MQRSYLEAAARLQLLQVHFFIKVLVFSAVVLTVPGLFVRSALV